MIDPADNIMALRAASLGCDGQLSVRRARGGERKVSLLREAPHAQLCLAPRRHAARVR